MWKAALADRLAERLQGIKKAASLLNDANKDVLIETLKRKIKALENENKELREQMKKAYAQIYKKF